MLRIGHLVTRWTWGVSVWYNNVNLHVPQHIRIFCLSVVPIWQMLTWFVSSLDFDHNVSIFHVPPQKFHRLANFATTVQKSSSFKIYRCKDLRSMNIGWTHKCAEILPSQAYRVGRHWHCQWAPYDMWQSAVQGGAGETISETSETKR